MATAAQETRPQVGRSVGDLMGEIRGLKADVEVLRRQAGIVADALRKVGDCISETRQILAGVLGQADERETEEVEGLGTMTVTGKVQATRIEAPEAASSHVALVLGHLQKVGKAQRINTIAEQIGLTHAEVEAALVAGEGFEAMARGWWRAR
ncbi:MAG TPA: hypothetical protein PLE19_12830 [Planctomycetota bacterium]|nr:hypothetical protein [Planctomycetota bacterium]HRR82922.1 hypothetical protein [Planctomycetota bacterium]HRT95776.1 hypothetical protein [Planctomycetota bacterium]